MVFRYEGELFPAKIVKFETDEVLITSMVKSIKEWKWPDRPDVSNYVWE